MGALGQLGGGISNTSPTNPNNPAAYMNVNQDISKWGKKLNPGLDLKPLQAAQAIQPVTLDQIQAANQGTQQSLSGASGLLAALQAQNGQGNQSAIFNQGQNLSGQLANANGIGSQQQAMGQQGMLANQLGDAGGIGYQQTAAQGLQDVYGRQAQTAAQLQGIANGTGPNPAQAALNESTGQNVANQAALMAGQRGAGANVGLIARQAAQQGAATQQQAAGQSATMQAQQELGALGQLTGQQQAMAGTAQGLAGIGSGLTTQQQAAIAQQYGQGAGIVGQQQNQLGQNAGIAQNQVGNTLNAQQMGIQGNLGYSGQQLGALGQYNASNISAQNALLGANSAQNVAAQQGRQGIVGGLLNGVGGGLSSIFGGSSEEGARGGMVSAKKMADGGMADPEPGLIPPMQQGPQSSIGQYLVSNAWNKPDTSNKNSDADTISAIGSFFAANGGLANGGGNVAASSPKEKAVKRGNSYANDKIPALLSEGEIVIPRDIVQSKDPARSAADFVAKVMAKRRIGK